MENWGIEKSDHVTWKLYISHICLGVTEIFDNEGTYPKK